MERNNRIPSRDRIDESYLRQLLREGSKYSQRDRAPDGCACNLREGAPDRDFGYVPTACGTNAVKGRPLAMVYAEKQNFSELYDVKEALKRGTLFKQLDLPFMGSKG